MKKAISLILVAVMCVFLLTGCCLSHDWVEADCDNPKTCAKCEKTEGEALGHDVTEADCLNPRTCTRCGLTEGEALGHDWADADCVNPKTCTRCSLTEGEALGHSYSGWKPLEDSMMINSCDNCGESESAPLDRETIGRYWILGKWELVSVSMNDSWMNYSPGWTLTFYEDGGFDIKTTDEESGELIYSEFYDGDYMDLYVFDGIAGDSSYSINYDPAEDVVYIIGSMFFKFTRVAE